ncbi:mitochondrial carnitine/acylcarnitine carrier protein [Thraustotheca clavata]|uniref:Mitochondrial carnitine/acylcarnitine carrier protein n=1 Tax=Thraustotheca clavata TaxID=74557 RepID=A0A1W0A7C8_9STRA|nr:mitochondrial carnitine/acylcarnitine carrier protein [Thraustotheca clavata]
MEWIDIFKDLYAGTVGGVAGIIAGHPLDTIKVRMQTQSHTSKRSSVVQSFQSIARTEGIRGFYKGMVSPIVSNAPINAAVFAIYGQTSRLLSSGETLSPGQQFLAGAMSGLAQVIFSAPAELVKIQMQVDTHARHKSSFECARRILKKHGLSRGLYHGWQLTVLRDVPAFGSYFFTYELAKEYLSDDAMPTTMTLLLAGGIAGSMSWVLTQPIDVVKTLAQSQRFEEHLTTRTLIKHHLRLEGPQFLTKGFTATVLRAFPVSAVTFLVYERTMEYLNIPDADNTLHMM